jgi:hypothetical protein
MADASKQSSKWETLRKRAEVLLPDHSCALDRLAEADILHLISELEVHQIELENRKLETLMHRYWDL